MRVPQRLDYALRGMTALAQAGPGACIAAGDVADSLGLPRRFVEQQFSTLSRSGLVDCRRGAGGGCSLGRDAASITVADIVRAVQGGIVDVPHVTGSAVSEMWSGVAATLEQALGATTLADLAARQAAVDSDTGAMYYI